MISRRCMCDLPTPHTNAPICRLIILPTHTHTNPVDMRRASNPSDLRPHVHSAYLRDETRNSMRSLTAFGEEDELSSALNQRGRGADLRSPLFPVSFDRPITGVHLMPSDGRLSSGSNFRGAISAQPSTFLRPSSISSGERYTSVRSQLQSNSFQAL